MDDLTDVLANADRALATLAALDSVMERVAHTIFCGIIAGDWQSRATEAGVRKIMNPLTSLTGTIIAGLALLVVMVFVINVIGS